MPSEAKFLIPELEDIVDYGIGLSYRPAMQAMPCSRLWPPQSGTKNLASIIMVEAEAGNYLSYRLSRT
jgi:hypothetical protein